MKTWIKKILRPMTERVRRAGAKIYHLPFLHPVLEVIGRTGKGFFADECHIMSAAMSFYAVLSLIPFLLLLFSICGYVLNNLGQNYANPDELFSHITTYVRAVVPFLGEDVIERLHGMTSSRQVYGITGLGILLITSWLVFRCLELAFARIFKTKGRRSLVLSQLLFSIFVLALGIMFLLIHYLGILVSTFYRARDFNFGAQIDQILGDHWLLRIGITIFTGTLVFIIVLKYFSHARIRYKYAASGGLLFSLLWMAAIRAFGYYLDHIARFSLLYGSLATLAIIVVWMYYSSCVLLLCAEFTFVLQNRSAPPSESRLDQSANRKPTLPENAT